MTCKYCGRELDETMKFCPSCGKAFDEETQDEATEVLTETEGSATDEESTALLSAEECVEEAADEATEAVPEAAEEVTEAVPEAAEEVTEAPAEAPKKKFPVVAVVLCGLAACAAVALILFGSQLVGAVKNLFKAPRGEGVAYTQELLTQRDAYSVQDIESPEDERMQTVVAYCGETELTNADLQVLYCDSYFQFMNSYGYYASYFGLDTSIPLCEQDSMTEGMTWEHTFLADAMSSAHALAAVREYCKENGMELTEELQADIDSLQQTLEENAVSAGYDSALTYVQDSFGKGIDMDDFMRYYEDICYEQMVYETLTCTDEEIEAYYEENAETLASYGVSKEVVDVRHILIQPEDADEDGTSTDEEWAAAEAEAQRIYALYLENPTEDYFAELAGEYTTDTGSQENGGLYEDVTSGEMVTEFNDWIFADGRQYGDTEVILTDYGYHVMFFVELSESETWKDDCESYCRSEKMSDFLTELMEKYPFYVYIDDIVLDELQKPEETSETTETETVTAAG